MSIMSPPTAPSSLSRSRRPTRSRAAGGRLLLDQPGQAEAAAVLEELPPRLRLLRQAPQADEPLGVLVPEAVARLVGRQPLAVQAVLALAADHRRLALEQLHPHLA